MLVCAGRIQERYPNRLLDGTYAPGAALPNERSLANEIGVTRPTLCEMLQRLANEGWITIVMEIKLSNAVKLSKKCKIND